MAKLRQVAQIGESVLRERAKKVPTPITEDIRTLAEEMIHTCQDAGCLALAAPQVYESLRLIILALAPSIRHQKAKQMETMVLLNPKMIEKSSDKETDWETCMSIPNLRGKVSRHTWTTVQFTDLEGVVKTVKFEGLASRAVQQKMDCLRGTLFLDKTRPRERMSEKVYLKLEGHQAPKL